MEDEDQFTKDFNARYKIQMEEEEKQFTKGFNAGYLLSKHEPELLGRVLQLPNENDVYINGMQCGKKQHEKEKVLEQIKQAQQRPKDKERER